VSTEDKQTKYKIEANFDSLAALRAAIQEKFKIDDSFRLRYYDNDFDFVDFKDLSELPKPLAQLQILPTAPVPPLVGQVEERKFPRNSGEGLWVNDPIISYREQTCRKIYDIITQEGIVLLRSPPFTGKTSIVSLLHHYISGIGVKTYWISCLSFQEDLDELFRRKINMSFKEIVQTKEKTILLIDEAQILYFLGQNHEFWRIIKELQQSSNQYLNILFVASYGEAPMSVGGTVYGTPVVFKSYLDISTMYFSEGEANEMIQSFHKTDEGSLVSISPEVAKVIYSCTSGHPGLFRTCLNSLAEKFTPIRQSKKEVSDGDKISYLMSHEFKHRVSLTRAVNPPLSFESPEREFIDKLLRNDTMLMPEKPQDENTCLYLIRAGIFARNNDRLSFPAPLLRMIYMQRLHSSTVPTEGSEHLEPFIIESIRRMDHRTLRNSLGVGTDDKILERGWGMEFYRTSTSILTASHSISPEVGRTFHSQGLMDFYIDGSLKWAIELLREGDRAKEHQDRFKPGGMYYIMRDNINEIVLLDFRSKPIKKMRNHFWYIIYNLDYSRVTIRRKDLPDEIIDLSG